MVPPQMGRNGISETIALDKTPWNRTGPGGERYRSTDALGNHPENSLAYLAGFLRYSLASTDSVGIQQGTKTGDQHRRAICEYFRKSLVLG